MDKIMVQIDGANIDSIGYYSWQKIVAIEFTNGSKYQYYDVPEKVYKGLMESPSKGSYIHRRFKNVYRYARVDEFEKHLCYICKNAFPECESKNVKFGDGIGDDNVISCESYAE